MAKSQIRGVPGLRRTLQSIDPLITVEVREAIRAAADQIYREALSRVPRKTGKLASAMRVAIVSNGFGAKIGVFGKRALKQAYYAKWIEFGTSKRPATPFLYPALKARGPAAVKSIEAAVSRALHKAANVTTVPSAGTVTDEETSL